MKCLRMKSINKAAFDLTNSSHEVNKINNDFHYSKEGKLSPSKKLINAYWISPNIIL